MNQANQDLLQTTIQALKGGLTGIPLSTAMDNTENWQQQFLQSGDPGLQDVAREIGNLQSLLTHQPLSGIAIGRSLSMLGAQTNQAAAKADPDDKKSLNALGDLLLRIGGELENS